MSDNTDNIEPKVQISLFIPRSPKKRIANYCVNHDVTQAAIVTDAIVRWLDEKAPELDRVAARIRQTAGKDVDDDA